MVKNPPFPTKFRAVSPKNEVFLETSSSTVKITPKYQILKQTKEPLPGVCL
jgi:hypothetical protein